MTRGGPSEPTTLDRSPARPALIGWSIATVIALVPAVLSIVAVVRAWHAPPTTNTVTGDAYVSGVLGKPSLTVATPNGLTQLVGRDELFKGQSQAVFMLGPGCVVSAHPVTMNLDIDLGDVRSVAKNGDKLAFAFEPGMKESRGMLYVEGTSVHEIPVPGEKSWLMGLHGEGNGFAGYIGGIDVEGADGDASARQNALLRLMAGRVSPRVNVAAIDGARVTVGAAIDVEPFGGQWVNDVMFVDGAPVFVLGSGVFSHARGYARADGKPVPLPDDAFTASAISLRDHRGTFVTPSGETRAWRGNEGGLHLCAAGDSLEPMQVTTTALEITTRGCGHTFRVRREASGPLREVRGDEGPWRPLGSGVRDWSLPVADLVGDRWLVRRDDHLEWSHEVLLFDVNGERVDAPSRIDTVWKLAGSPSLPFLVGLALSWGAALAAVVFLVRALRLVRRVRVGKASRTSTRPGLFTGVLEKNGRELRIAVGSRVTDHVVLLGDAWPKSCVFSGRELTHGNVDFVATLENPAPAGEGSFREAAPSSLPKLVPATSPPLVFYGTSAEAYLSRAFVWVVVAYVAAIPMPLALVIKLGLGPY